MVEPMVTYGEPMVTHGEQGLGELRERLQEKMQRALPQVNFVPWIALGCDFMPPATNIQFNL